MCCLRRFRKKYPTDVFDNIGSIYNYCKYNTTLHYSEHYSLGNDSSLRLMHTDAFLLTTPLL